MPRQGLKLQFGHHITKRALKHLRCPQLLCRDPRTLPAGGATEVEVARQLSAFGSKMTGLEQYAVAQFAEALEVVPRTIAENSGGCRYVWRTGYGLAGSKGTVSGSRVWRRGRLDHGCQQPCVSTQRTLMCLARLLIPQQHCKTRLASAWPHLSNRPDTGWQVCSHSQNVTALMSRAACAGLNATEVLAALRAAHAEGRMAAGLDVVTGQARDLAEDGIVDLYQTKWWALRLAADAAVTVLKVDQIIMVRSQPWNLTIIRPLRGGQHMLPRCCILRAVSWARSGCVCSNGHGLI